MSELPRIIAGLREIAGPYDALVCDVWGVVHDGVTPFWPAIEALRRFREQQGPVVLLTNAPRPAAEIVASFARIGVPPDCYDHVVTSGGAARADLASRAGHGRVAMFHLGPERDQALYQGLDVSLVGPDAADVVLCTGLFDDETETPEHYREVLAALRARGLPMICANPDVLVPRGGRLLYCAGGLARAYEQLGGEVAYYGKPHLPIYKVALEAAGAPRQPLVVGDGLETDIRGANRAGFDALFVVHGVHAGEVDGLTPEALAALFAGRGVSARAAMRALAW
ncbi:MAG: TIGR01459 family HAD-type hydrolase [Alphaproteobacteria bacterium]|nr:TIGR01459 family HAD-type hydrolase [Alphaproteobacteria bacterium]